MSVQVNQLSILSSDGLKLNNANLNSSKVITDKIYYLPNTSDDSDTLLTNLSKNVLLNKTLDDNTNIIRANKIGSDFSVSIKGKPIEGDVLTATSETEATWKKINPINAILKNKIQTENENENIIISIPASINTGYQLRIYIIGKNISTININSTIMYSTFKCLDKLNTLKKIKQDVTMQFKDNVKWDVFTKEDTVLGNINIIVKGIKDTKILWYCECEYISV